MYLYPSFNRIFTEILWTLLLTATAMLSLLITTGHVVQAKDYDARVKLDQRSREVGLGVPKIELLQRLPGIGPEKMLHQMIERFEKSQRGITTQGDWKYVQSHQRHRAVADGWRIRVSGDGTRLSYTNQSYFDRAEVEAISLPDRFDNDTLEKLGRQFIDTALAGWVTLGQDEELVPLYTEFELTGGINAEGEADPQRILSSAIHFGRRVKGVDIVGPGSKITIYFDNKGQPYDFDVDWPRYKPLGKVQQVIGVDEVLKRLSTYGTMPKAKYKVELKRFECGYFDAGVLHRVVEAPVQAGCVAHTVETKIYPQGGTAFESATFNVVPAGKVVEPDRSWPETLLINKLDEQCLHSESNDCMSGDDPPKQGSK